MDLLGGLNQDFLHTDQPESTYRWALNWIVNQKEGTLQSEPGFDFEFNLRNELKPIGLIGMSDGVVIFSTNESGTDCEIGLYSEVPKQGWFINDTTSQDFPARSYIPILNNGIATLLGSTINSTELNFSLLHQIQGRYRYNNVRELEVAFTDWFNVPRVLYLGDFKTLKRHYDPYSAGSLEVFQRFKVADVTRSIERNGSLPAATYFLFYRYQNSDLSTTQIAVVDRPIYITNGDEGKPASIWGETALVVTDKGLTLEIDNVDTSFPYIQIGLFRVFDNKAVIVTTQSINGSDLGTISITKFEGDGTLGSGDLEGGNLNLLVQEIRYIKAKTVGVQGSRLYFGNLTGNDSLVDGVSQKYINSSKVEWILDLVDTFDDTNNIKGYNNYYDQQLTKSFQAGEVYAFFCRARLKDGTLTSWFHIPGPEATPFNLLIVPPTLTNRATSIGGINPTDKINDLNIITEGNDEFLMEKDIMGSDDGEIYQLRDTVSFDSTIWNRAFTGDSNQFGYWENKGEKYNQYFLDEDLDVIDATAYSTGIVTKRLEGNVRHCRFPSNFWINNAWHEYLNMPLYDRNITIKQHAIDGTTPDLFITKQPRLGIRFTEPFLPPDIAEKVDYWETGYAGRDGRNCTVLGQDLSLFGTKSSYDTVDGNNYATIEDIEGVKRGIWGEPNNVDGASYGGSTSFGSFPLLVTVNFTETSTNYAYYGDTSSRIPTISSRVSGSNDYMLEADGGIPTIPLKQMIVHPDIVEIGVNSSLNINYVSYEAFFGRRAVNPNGTLNNGIATKTKLGKYPDLGNSYNYPAYYLPTNLSVTTVTNVKALKDDSSFELKYDTYDGSYVPLKDTSLGYTPDVVIESFSDNSLSSITLNRKVASRSTILLDSKSTVGTFTPGMPEKAINTGDSILGYGTVSQPAVNSSEMYLLSFDAPVGISKFPLVSDIPTTPSRAVSHYGFTSKLTTTVSINYEDYGGDPSNPNPSINVQEFSIQQNIPNDNTEFGSRFLNGINSRLQDNSGNHSRKDLLCTYRRYTQNVYSGLFNSLGIIKAGETNKETDMFFGDVFLTKVNYKVRSITRSHNIQSSRGVRTEGDYIFSSPGGITRFPYQTTSVTSHSFPSEERITEFNFFSTTRRNLNYKKFSDYVAGYPDSNKPNPLYDVQNYLFPKTETSLKTLDTSILAGKYPFRVIWSELQGTDAKINNWRKFKSTNLYEMDKVKGEITNLEGYDDQLLIHTEKALWITRPNARISLDDVSNYSVVLGTGQLFDPPPQEISPNPLGLGGTVHQFSCVLSKQGYSFIDANTGRFYLYRKDFGATIGNLGELGMFQFLESYTKLARNDFSNNRAAGLSAFVSYYDTLQRRILLGYNQEGLNIDTGIIGDWERDIEENYLPYTLSISEVANDKLAFTSFHDYKPDIAVSTNFQTYSFKGQKFYKHNSQNSINKFYHEEADTQKVYNSVIDIVFNTAKLRTKDGATVEGAKNAMKLFQAFIWQTDTSLIATRPPANELRERYLETFDFATVYTTKQLSERIALVPFTNIRQFNSYWNFNSFRDNLLRNSYPSTNRLENFTKFIGDPIQGFPLDYTQLDSTKAFNTRFVDTFAVLRLEYSPLYTLQNTNTPIPIKQISILDVDSSNNTTTKG